MRVEFTARSIGVRNCSGTENGMEYAAGNTVLLNFFDTSRCRKK